MNSICVGSGEEGGIKLWPLHLMTNHRMMQGVPEARVIC